MGKSNLIWHNPVSYVFALSWRGADSVAVPQGTPTADVYSPRIVLLFAKRSAKLLLYSIRPFLCQNFDI